MTAEDSLPLADTSIETTDVASIDGLIDGDSLAVPAVLDEKTISAAVRASQYARLDELRAVRNELKLHLSDDGLLSVIQLPKKSPFAFFFKFKI
jgi:hypothetical protein